MVIDEKGISEQENIYYRLGCIISIISHENRDFKLTSFDVTNKILPAIRFSNCLIFYNDNGHPVSFVIWKKINSRRIESLKKACCNWHQILGWNEGEDYFITHFHSQPRYRLSTINFLKNEKFGKGDIVYYINKRNKLIRRVL
ncbi:toxin-activating lysine-acyltransferase [Vibrio cholerae]